MAQIEFDAFVEDWSKDGRTVDWAIKTAEQHRKQVDGEWTTTGRTFRTVKAGYGVSIDFSQFKKGDRVTVIGKEQTDAREYQGKTYYDLVVKADSIQLHTPKGRTQETFTPAFDQDEPF
jgi:hypothetical protein